MKANFIGNKKIDKKILREMLSQAKLRCQVRYGRGLEEVRFSCNGRILTKSAKGRKKEERKKKSSF